MSDSETPPQHSESPGDAMAPAASLRPRPARRPRRVWFVLAVVCVAAGIAASLLGAHAFARSDSAKARSSFRHDSVAIASTLKLAIQREEELAVGASTFFAGNPKSTPAEFARWVKWARTLRRFPELENLGFVSLVRRGQLAAFEAQTSRHTLKRQATSAPTHAPARLRILPASDHHYYCLASVQLARGPAAAAAAGLDYCGPSPALLLARNQGLSEETPVSLENSQALMLETPVYKGNATPRSVVGRKAAFVGWLRELLVPGVVLSQALKGHPGMTASLSLQTGTANMSFHGGTPRRAAQSASTSLQSGWTVTSFGAPADSGVLEDRNALALLVGGTLLSGLLGLLVFVLGAGRGSTRAPRPKPRGVANEELYDPLTALPNRALMLDRADCMLARSGRQSGLLVGALFIDIDWFKDVNDKLGQAAGDQLLRTVAERLENVVRAGDTVGRLGDDEFVVLVESAARGARLDALARRVIEALHKPFELADYGPNFFMTASIGLAFGRYATPADLLRDAQLALHAAKAAGKDRYTLFNANMRSVIEGRGVLEAELNTALQERQFSLLYQPIYDLRVGQVAGLEARVRWVHPKKGLLSDADFLPLAAETGLIVPIGRWVLEEACSRAAAWNVTGHRIGISVQVAPNQLNRDGFATDVRRALQQSGLEPSLLTLEIAETTVMSDVNAAVARLTEVKRLGVRVAVDDFGGSGYAHHSDLRRLPLDFLKVDRSSLAAAEDEDYRSWLLEAILIVGRDLSLTVIAKGIETFEQMSSLETMGCTMAQGPFMGDPTPVEGVEGLFDVDLPRAQATSDGLLN
jgi:diguanylate cyclase (GGDEF)-like protein